MPATLTDEQARNIARILWGARQRRAREAAESQPPQEREKPPQGKDEGPGGASS